MDKIDKYRDFSEYISGTFSSPRSVVQTGQLFLEIFFLHIEIQKSGIVDKDGEGALRQRNTGLTKDLIQYPSVLLSE